MKIKNRTIVFMVIAVLLLAVWIFFEKRNFKLPKGESKSSSIKILDNGVETIKNIMVTKGVKHSVPLDQIVGGGPGKDGIPSIDSPTFESVESAGGALDDDERGVLLVVGDVARFYPYNILVWHEIVNDSINGKRYTVTYCPLCGSSIVFDPLVDNEEVDFGVSGKLWNSNLVMYDRKTESLWSQVLGEAIVGEKTGAKLDVVPSDIINFREFKENYPSGQVLSRETNVLRDYSKDPYEDYYGSNDIYFPVNNTDSRLSEKDFVYGIIVRGQAKAYFGESVKNKGELEDNFAGKNLVVRYNKKFETVRIFEKLDDGEEERVSTFPNFWFSWAAAHPDTELYK